MSISSKSGAVAVALLVALVLLLTAGVVTRVLGVGFTYSEGERTGVLLKISKKGYVWKTWEGEMNLGGMAVDGEGIAVPNIWRFSVEDDEVAKQGMAIATEGKRVTISYREVWRAAFWQGETDYFVTGFRQAAPH